MVRYLFICILLFSSLASGIYFFRNELIQISFNSLFRSRGIYLTTLNGLKFDLNTLAIDELELELGDTHTNQRFEKIVLGYSIESQRVHELRIRNASVSAANFPKSETASVPLLLSELLNQSSNQVVDKLQIEKLDLRDIGRIVRLQWQHEGNRQTVLLSDNHHETELTLYRRGSDNTQVSWLLRDPHHTIIRVELELKRVGEGYRVTGSSDIDLSSLPKMLQPFIDSWPGEIDSIGGELKINLENELEDDLRNFGKKPVSAQLRPDSNLSLSYRKAKGLNSQTLLSVAALSPIDLRFTHGRELEFVLSSSRLAINIQEKLTPFLATANMSEILCRWKKSLKCSMDVYGQLNIPKISSGDIQAERIAAKVRGHLHVENDRVSLRIEPSELAEVKSLKSVDLKLKNLKIRSESAGHLNYGMKNDRLKFQQKRILFDVPGFETPQFSGLTKFEITDVNLQFNDSIAGTVNIVSEQIKLRIPGKTIPKLGLKAKINLSLKRLSLNAYLLSDKKLQLAEIVALHRLDRRAGSAKIKADLAFNRNSFKLSDHFRAWPYNWDIQKGLLSAQAKLHWVTRNDRLELSGTMTQRLKNISGFHRDLAFFGLDGEASLDYQAPDSIVSKRPSEVRLRELDVGFPINDIRLSGSIDSRDQNLALNHLDAKLLGGSIHMHDFIYQPKLRKNTFLVYVKGLRIKELLSLANLETVYADGRISGELPIVLGSTGLSIDQGLLAAEKPGGVIRYRPDSTAKPTADPNPALRFVAEALSNYHYDTLRIVIHYTEAGDLNLEMKLKGFNPDMENGRPINLNLNISDNVPTLLRSLQSGRIITELLEKKLSRP